MGLNATGRKLTEQATRALEAVKQHFSKTFEKIECVSGYVIKCNCTVPRGYWFGMPLLVQREPRIVQLDQLLILSDVRIRHGTCIICNTLFFKELNQVKDEHADTSPICEQHSSSVETAG